MNMQLQELEQQINQVDQALVELDADINELHQLIQQNKTDISLIQELNAAVNERGEIQAHLDQLHQQFVESQAAQMAQQTQAPRRRRYQSTETLQPQTGFGDYATPNPYIQSSNNIGVEIPPQYHQQQQYSYAYAPTQRPSPAQQPLPNHNYRSQAASVAKQVGATTGKFAVTKGWSLIKWSWAHPGAVLVVLLSSGVIFNAFNSANPKVAVTAPNQITPQVQMSGTPAQRIAPVANQLKQALDNCSKQAQAEGQEKALYYIDKGREVGLTCVPSKGTDQTIVLRAVPKTIIDSTN